MRERATRGEVSPYHFAEAYLGLGDTDRALEYLRRSHELNLPDLIGLFVDPLFRPLRGNAAFERLLRDFEGPPGSGLQPATVGCRRSTDEPGDALRAPDFGAVVIPTKKNSPGSWR